MQGNPVYNPDYRFSLTASKKLHKMVVLTLEGRNEGECKETVSVCSEVFYGITGVI